jgi:hypothetical protein
MAKEKLLIPVLVGFICLFGLVAPAYAAPMHSLKAKPSPGKTVQPNFGATGGGCQYSYPIVNGFTMRIEACISATAGPIGYTLNPDGYVTFPSGLAGTWTFCNVDIVLYRDDGTYEGDEGNNCINYANFSGGGTYHFGPYSHSFNGFGLVCPVGYYGLVRVTGTVGGSGINDYAISNTETIVC